VAIRLCGSGSRATGNIVVSASEDAAASLAIMVGHEQAGAFAPVSRISVVGNTIEGRQYGIGMAGVSFGEISGNIIGRDGERIIVAIALNEASDCIVADNELIRPAFGIFATQGARNTIENNRIEGGSVGVAVTSEQAPTVSGCRLTGVDTFGIIAVGTTQRCDMTGNRVIRCGSGAAIATAMGAFAVFGEWHVEANEIMDTGLPPEPGGPIAPLAYGISGDYILEASVESNLVTYSAMDSRNAANEDRALRMRGFVDMRVPLGGGVAVFGYPIQIANNKFIGPGATALVELREQEVNDNVFIRFERALYSGNYCSHFSGPRNDATATVHLRGRALTVSGNHVKALTPAFPSYHLNGDPGPFIGNVSHGPVLGRAVAFPNPEASFNSTI
jgi:parallel beta-helix repeat protein